MGPMSAAARFLELILSDDWPRPQSAHVASLKASLHGSLAHTGIGHGTGRAVILGLAGELPDKVDPDRMDAIIEGRGKDAQRHAAGPSCLSFQSAEDLVFDKKQPLSGHANGMRLSAFDQDGRLLLTQVYYSSAAASWSPIPSWMRCVARRTRSRRPMCRFRLPLRNKCLKWQRVPA